MSEEMRMMYTIYVMVALGVFAGARYLNISAWGSFVLGLFWPFSLPALYVSNLKPKDDNE